MIRGGRTVVLACALLVGACAPALPTPAWTVAPPTVAPASPATTPPTPGPSPARTPAASPTATPAATPTATPAASPVAGGWRYVGHRACPESRFDCVTLAVPRDHFVAGGATWEVTFAIQRASKRRLGTFVVITGGPGSSGIAAADGYTDAYPASIPERFDIVFLDQRGIGLSQPFQCPEATGVYYASTVRPQDPAQAEAAGAVAAAYVDACLAEARVPAADLPLFSTRQAVEDLEAIREYLGVERLDLYGESYGTQYVQTYATAYPDHIATLYLDGPVDLTLDGADYYAEAVRSFDDVLVATLNGCAAEPACAADFEGGPLATYDELAARLAAGPIPIAFPMGDGSIQQRTLSVADLENAAVSYLFSPGDRAILERALAAASRDDLVPLARLAYASIAIDPDTLRVEPDPTWSDAMYYAVECQDYVYNADAANDADRLAAFLAEARVLGVDAARLGALYYGDMPCLYWPNRPAVDPRPAPIVAAPYPTIVMVATTDPITPVANAIRIANRLTDVRLIIQAGGPHVIFGWGLSCPDDVIADYMTRDVRPRSAITVCQGSVADPYVPIAKGTEGEYADALDLMGSLADQVLNSNDYAYRLEDEPLAVGCDFGGVLEYRPTDSGTDLAFRACELTDGMPVTGSGSINDETGALRLDVTVPDGSLRYRMNGNGDETVKGTFRGAPAAGSG